MPINDAVIFRAHLLLDGERVSPEPTTGHKCWALLCLLYPLLGAGQVAWVMLALCNRMDCSPPGSLVHGTLQARILESVATPSSRGIFLTQGSNPCLWCLLYWQVIYLPLYHLPRWYSSPLLGEWDARRCSRFVLKLDRLGLGILEHSCTSWFSRFCTHAFVNLLACFMYQVNPVD